MSQRQFVFFIWVLFCNLIWTHLLKKSIPVICIKGRSWKFFWEYFLSPSWSYWKTVDWEVISDLEPMFGIEFKGQVFSGWNLWLKHIFSFFDLVGWNFRQLEHDSMPLYTCTTWNEISSFNINFVCIIFYADFFTR